MQRRCRYLLAGCVLALASAAIASETVTYSYDALGRLTAMTSSGSANNGVTTGIAYDPAGNRSAYNVSGVVTPPPEPPEPPVTPAPPPPPAFAVSGGTVNEGGNLAFTVSRSNLTAGTFSVSYATSNGSAAQYSDYYPASGTLTFTTGASQTVSVLTVKDNVAEPAETMLMTLSNPTGGATIQAGAGQATGTINASAANAPPTAVADNFSVARCTAGSFNVVANDTDPEGDYPLVLVAVSGQAAQQGASVGSSTNVAWAKARYAGGYYMGYTVADSRNASSSGTLKITVTGSGSTACP
ncbi:MAG TPA: Calx-beta domain-containing protein [Allosphingosinicella sp.]|jgi:hypothetical protein